MRAADAFFLLAFVLAGCTRGKVEEAPMVEKIGDDTLKLSESAMKRVKTAKVEEGDFPERLSLMGRVSIPEDRITVVPARVAGRIDGIYVATGEAVRAGQVVAELFSSDYAVAREEYLQAFQDAKTGKEEARRLVALARRKLEALGLSRADIEGLPAASTERAKANFAVRAPRGGVVIDKKAIVGNFVNQGDTLFTVGDLSKVWFAGDLYPEDLPKIHKGQEVVIDPVVAGSPTILGSVFFISPVVDPTTRTIKIRAMMDNPDRALRADMYVRGNVTLSTKKALLIPVGAVIRLNDQSFVFKRVDQNKFRKVPITLGGEQRGMAAVASGLSSGDLIVSEGGLLLEAALSSSAG